jgi:DNA-binding transcriptional LysR family regulator
MTLNQLRVFAAVCRQSSITKASVALRISEPSVFQQVKSLETSLGVKLYRKVGRVIQLTREGRAVQGDIEEVLAKIEKLASRFKPSATPSRLESLVIGGSHAPAVAFLPSLIGQFKKNHPLVQLVLRSKSSQTIERLILESEVEIGLITRPSQSPGLHSIPYRFEKFVGFISAKHPLARKAKLTIAEVAQCPLIVKRNDDSKSSSCLRQMEAAGCRPNVLMQCESAEAIKLAVLNGMGIGFLYEDHVKSEIKKRDLKVVKIEGINPPDVQSFIVFNKNHALSRNGEAFLSLLASAVDGSITIEQFTVAPDSKVA